MSAPAIHTSIMKTVIIDNYDSFTYNLYHLVREAGMEADVLRNDAFRLEDLEAYDKIILSPGPGIPQEAGLLPDVIRTFAGRKPMLGVCLGHQAITIRTFVSRNNELWFQAGGGIVAKSNEDYELQEVNNKLGALRRAIEMAEKL